MVHDELGRDISDDERKLAFEVLLADDKQPYEQVRAIRAGNLAGLHEQRTRQIVRTWANDGICRANKSGANLLTLTDYGRRLLADIKEDR